MLEMKDILMNMNSQQKEYGLNDTLYPYNHTTFVINSLSDYIDIILGFNKALGLLNASVYNIYYRGMSDKSWKPIPSLARNRGLERNEAKIIDEFRKNYPEEFSRLSSKFELLSNMQHYGLPTRLLDFTQNPLIALFFSCKEMNSEDGRVLCFFGSTHNTEARVEILSDIACNGKENECIDNYIIKKNMKVWDFLSEMFWGGNVVLAKPTYWNDRQKRQQSVFLVFNNLIEDVGGKFAYLDLNYSIVDPDMIKRIKDKENIVEIYSKSHWEPSEYDLKNFNEKHPLSFILTNETWNALFISHNEYENFDEIYNRRFVMTPQIDVISDYAMSHRFCSIIISKENKPKILKELEVLGIDEAFVYPEMEYTAKKVKEKYENYKEYRSILL